MSVLSRLLIGSAERLDLPDLLSIDSYAAGDWKFFLKGLVGDSKPYILKGFNVIDPLNAIGTQSCSIKVADSMVFYPGSNSGSFFHGLQEGHPQAAPVVPELRKNAVNYVYLTFSTFNNSVDTRAFWDPDKDGGAGGEFTQDVNTQSVLKVDVNVSTGSFPANTIPVAKITVGPVVITAIEDARDLMFRLGSGGITPNPFNQYSWRSLPSSPYQRAEPPTKMLAGGIDPFQGADKNILSLKEWMDAIMTKLRELGGTIYWYEDTSTYSLISNFIDSNATAFKSKGKWLHDGVTPGLLTWTEDLNIKITNDPRSYIIRNGSKTLTDEQVMYVPMIRQQPINSTDEQVAWINGQNYVNTIGGAVGLFANLAKGDYVKKINDTNDKYLRVEEFYDAVNLGGSTTTAANARSIRLSGNYAGTTVSEKGRYDKGVYLASDVVVSDRNTTAISNIGGNFHWLAMRSDTIENVSNIQTTSLTVDITDHDGSTAKVTSGSVHGLVDGDRVTISGSTNFDGTYQVEVESTTVFYINISGGPFGDESSIDCSYATVTTSARSTPYGLQLESANHGFNSNETIEISDTTNYDGSYLINVRNATSFTIPVSSAQPPETSGLATLARIIVRREGSVTQIIQGETVNIGGTAADNIRQYLGMPSLAQTAPDYTVPVSYNTLDGMANYNSVVNENITARVAKLTSMMADKAQDKTIRALASNFESVTNTRNGSIQEITFNSLNPPGRIDYVMPGSDFDYGTVLLDGTLSLLANQVAYIEIDRNATFNYADFTAVTVANITDVNIDENIYIIAYRLGTREVWLWDGTYVPVGTTPAPSYLSQVVQQNNTTKLIKGGTWSWDLGTDTLTWDADAYIQIPGITEPRNTIQAGNAVLTADGDVAYVDIFRNDDVASNLTVTVEQVSTLALGLNRVIIARRVGNDIIVGNHSMLLVDGESKKLYAGMSDQNLSYIGATDEADADPNYTGPLRNIVQSQGLTGAVNSLDTELDKFFGQLQLRPKTPASTRVVITGVDKTMLNTAVLGQEIAGLLMKFDGAEIDFATGNIYESDGVTPLGNNFTPATIAANQFRWYSVALIPNVVDSQNRMTARVAVLAASANGSSAALAPRATFGGSKKIGQVVVQDNGAGGSGTILNINQDDVVQLGVGSGSGEGSSPKIIGGGTLTNVNNIGGIAGGQQLLNANNFALTPGSEAGSTFVAAATGELSTLAVKIDIGLATTATYTAKLYATSGGLPTGAALATSTNSFNQTSMNPSGTPTDLLFTFAPGVNLTTGITYAWAIDYSGDASSFARTAATNLIGFENVDDIAGWGLSSNQNSLYFDLQLDNSTVDLQFTADMFVEKAGLAYIDNVIDSATESPISFANDYEVAYVVPNLSSGGPNLAVTVSDLEDVPVGAIIIARREGNDIIVGSSSTRLRSGQSTEIYAQESIQSRNTLRSTDFLRSNDPVTWTGTNLIFTSNIVLETLNTRNGQTKLFTILSSNSPIVLANGEIAYIVIDREGVAGNVTPVIASSVPTVSSENQEIIIIAKRVDVSGTGYLHLPLHKQVIEPGQTVRLGASGSGGGNANEILETLKNHFQDSYFELLTPSVFETQGTDLVDISSTGSYSLVDKSYNLATIGQRLVSTQLLDPTEFLTSPESIGFAEFYVFWRQGNIDTNATYEISRNGGNEWQTISMDRVGSTEAYRGFHQFALEGSNQTILSEAPVSGTDALNASTIQELAQRITIASSIESRRVQLLLNKAGTAQGKLYVQIRTDNAGSPSSTVVAESNAIDIASLANGDITVNADFQSILAAGNYHIVLRTDATYKAGSFNLTWRRGTGSQGRSYNGTTWSTTGFDYGFNLLGITLDLRVRITSGTNDVKLDGYGVYYKKPAGQLVTGVKEIEIFKFSGDLNTTSFVVNNFVVNPDTLRVYDVNSGQVYRYGAFTVQGQTVSFDSGQFLSPGETVTLFFDQTSGSAYDNSDVNALLLASNHLGSPDPTIDKSVAGRGIFLRRPDGTLVELTINNDNEIDIYSV